MVRGIPILTVAQTRPKWFWPLPVKGRLAAVVGLTATASVQRVA
ncbi:uncharacterized protein G2W53_039301 [Senna tora]|uniref:Uncharacterized protein n=1 Tax=Senna tora TaxID=362788 RepID=A0A834W2Q3_9FABA|nr:uncharacterized protein G2W53_039301 [Senna tora]